MKATVLIVEDEARSRRLLHDLLEARSYRVIEAVDGEEALLRVAQELPDAILLDVMMPKLDGYAVCRRLREDARFRPIPVLMVTALHGRSDRLKGIEAGATDFISKPVDTEELLLRVRNAVLAKRLDDERLALLRRREDLSNMIVHDIRNPLLAIALCARGLQKKTRSPAVGGLAEAILEQTRQIDDFVDDLLNVARLERDDLPLRRTREDLVELGRTALRNHQVVADKKQIRLALETASAVCPAEIDRRLILRLMDNLIANAVKFSPERTRVVLTLIPAGAAGAPCLIRVEDEGPGMPQDYRGAVFETPGAARQPNAAPPRTGLGLAFCRMAAEAHGGRISVQGRQPRGSIFTVELP